MKITIDYDNGEIVQENKTVEFIQRKLAEGKDFSIGTDLLLTALRVEAYEGRLIPDSDVEVEGKEGPVIILEYPAKNMQLYLNGKGQGRLSEYPSDVLDKLTNTLLGWDK